MPGYVEYAEKVLCERMQLKTCGHCWIVVGEVSHVVQGKWFAIRHQAFIRDFVKVVPAVPEIHEIPCSVVAPVLCAIFGSLRERIQRSLRGHKSARSASGQGNLDAAKANVPVEIVFEDERGFKVRVEEPVDSISARNMHWRFPESAITSAGH